MNSHQHLTKYVAFLRGINVGGHHKVPMADLRQEMKKLGYQQVITLTKTPKGMEELEKLFGKEITTRNRNTIRRIAKKSAKHN